MADLNAHLSLQILDDLGVSASQPYYIQILDTDTVATISTALQAIITDVDAITDGQITLATLDLSIPLPDGVKTAPATGAEVERGGLFNFLQANVKYRFGVLVPAFKKSLIVSGKINLADTAVQAFITLVTALGGDAPWFSTGGNKLEAFKDALVTFRKHRKAENRRSFEE